MWRNVWKPACFLIPSLVAAGVFISGVTLLHLDKFATFGVGLLWFQVERDWRRLRHILNLMMAAAGLDLLMLLLYRYQVTGPALNLWLYCDHLKVILGTEFSFLNAWPYGYALFFRVNLWDLIMIDWLGFLLVDPRNPPITAPTALLRNIPFLTDCI